MPTPAKNARSAASRGLLPNPPPESSERDSLLQTSVDLKRMFADLQSECAAARVRQDELLTKILCKLDAATAGHASTEDAPANDKINLQIADHGSDESHLHLLQNADKEKNQEAALSDEGQNLSRHTSPSAPNVRTSSSRQSGRSSHGPALVIETIEEPEYEDKSLPARFDRMLKSKEFEFSLAFVLICNCLVMIWECQYQGLEVGFNLQYPGRLQPADMVWSGAETAFLVLDWIFGILFLLECLVKLICWQLSYFCDQWNILDFICVTAFFIGKIILSFGTFNPHMLRLFRLFRLARLVRLIRFLETMEALYVMTTAIAGMKKVLGWAIVLLSMILLTCDLALVQLLQATYFSDVDASVMSEDQLKNHHQMYAYFGTCTRCILSMFEITLGNWPPIARLLSEEVSEWFTLVCLVHKLTIGFAVVGVITGVIFQETFKVALTDDVIMLRAKRRAIHTLQEKLRHLFASLDKSDDDKVEFVEFQRICSDPNIKDWLGSLDIETDDLSTLFDLVDVDHSGVITTQELGARMPRIRGAARSIDLLSLHEKFNSFKL